MKTISRFGTKHAMLFSIPFLVLHLMGFEFLSQFSILFYIIPFLVAMKMVLFNYAFHLNFVDHSDKKLIYC